MAITLAGTLTKNQSLVSSSSMVAVKETITISLLRENAISDARKKDVFEVSVRSRFTLSQPSKFHSHQALKAYKSTVHIRLMLLWSPILEMLQI